MAKSIYIIKQILKTKVWQNEFSGKIKINFKLKELEDIISLKNIIFEDHPGIF